MRYREADFHFIEKQCLFAGRDGQAGVHGLMGRTRKAEAVRTDQDRTGTVASPAESQSRQPAVHQAVTALRRDSMAAAAGSLLGQEEELTTRYGISRPTLRQAAAIVSQEHLVRIRRGVGGGYFADRPDSSSVTHMAAIVLQLKGAGVNEMLSAIEAIRYEMVSLAIDAEETGYRELENLLEIDEAIPDEEYSYRRFLRTEREQNHVMANISGNQVLNLFMQILLELVGTLGQESDLLFGRRERFLKWRAQRNRMLDAVLGRDREIALIEARRCSELIKQWHKDDSAAELMAQKRLTKAPRA